uniref:Bifunctional lysine-specific demethylase and histidyl-hydroxylase n=1 Tax=Anthurium amnicola TaxID=1678845 RepID=A0A1D1ZFU6_9ARAE
MGFTKDIFQSSLLGAAIALVNSCNNEFLEQISGKVSRRFLFLVKEIWVRYSNQKGCLSASKHDLAETIFRLSMNQVNYMPYMPELIKRSMFGNDPSDFENFILNYWENSPFLLRNGSRNDGVIFNCLDFSSRTIDAAMDSILQSLVSCPHITSDELDILTFLDEVKGVLGSPMVYGQDIRVVKTQELLPGSTNENVKKEVHFFNCTSLTSVNGLAFTCNHIQNCKEAVQDGFTIALRGMEFRSKKIAGLSDGLAALFGQPLVGANVYLTPPNSQGLSRHYDDHCVFVCQLLGMKRWVVFPRSAPLLPRLYEPLDSLSPLEFAAKFSEGREFFLREGDILYIPRGCPHEAYTTVNERESQVEGSSFSLHLTLGIEVEPPFEWEGFAHVALHCWNQKLKEEYFLVDSTSISNFMIINSLHIAIRLIGDHDPAFRKACMVAASMQSDDGRVDQMQNVSLMQRSIFCNIINSIDVQSNFMEAFKKIEDLVHEKDDISLQWLRWIRHLPQEGNEIEKFDFDILLQAFDEFLLLTRGNIKAVETIFMQVKCQFCRSVTFEDVRESFESLLKKYKKVRRQYMNGMLSLHSAP